MKGYCKADDVAAYMGVTFTELQTALVELAIGAAEVWIDTNTQHAWLENLDGDTVVTEDIDLVGPGSILRVSKPPVLSFETVSYFPYAGADPIELLATDAYPAYYVRSLRDGRIQSPYFTPGYAFGARIAYKPNTDDVPAEIGLATIVLAASNIRFMPSLMDGADPSVVQRYEVGGELEVEFRRNLVQAGVFIAQAGVNLGAWMKGYSVI